MGSEPRETTVSGRGDVTVPASLRDHLDIEEGDKLRWSIEDDALRVEVVHQREGVFDDVEPVDMGETDAVEAKRTFRAEE